MHKSTEKYNDICALKHNMLHYVMGETEKGFEGDPAKVQVLKAYVEMIKCLAEAEKECQEADYYESVVDAMENSDMGYPTRMGYNPNRNRKGQYSDGRGRNRGSRTGDDSSSWGDSDSGNSRMGYTPDPYSRMMMDEDDWDDDIEDDRRYGKSFSRFRKAKRHYTESHSEKDRMKMEERANEAVMESMTTLREIWANADPELRKRMKTDLASLTASLNA